MSDDHQIPEDRATLYYIGNILVVIGMLLFFSVIVEGFLSVNRPSGFGAPGFGEMPNFGAPGWQPGGATLAPHGPSPVRALIGFGLIVVGGILRSIGAVGLAGAGIVLDPQRQRAEARPWSKMAGGMLDDALQEVDALKQGTPAAGRDTIRVRCPACRALNDEEAKFCDQCGKGL